MRVAARTHPVDAARLKLATDGAMLFYTVGRSYLLELYHSELQSYQVRIVDGPTTRRAYERLMALETEMRESGIVYSCLAG
jgi:hypothetical protein